MPYSKMEGTREFCFFFRCTKFNPCRSGEEHCTPLNVPYTSFVPFLLHVMLFRFSIYIFLKMTLVVSSTRSFYFSVSIHNCLFKRDGVSYHNVRQRDNMYQFRNKSDFFPLVLTLFISEPSEKEINLLAWPTNDSPMITPLPRY